MLEGNHVECIIKLAAELEVYFFPDSEVLVDIPIEVSLPIQAKRIAAKRTEIAQQRL